MKFSRYLVKKSVADIQSESQGSQLKRTLGPLNLVSLGIGCIIGAGIFVMTGAAAAKYAGPAIIYSFIIAGIACALAGLCYAELASVLPVSGSAYTYAYTTLGEFLAWVMGWLLVLEYGVASATVAVGWSGYVVSFLKTLGIIVPPALTASYGQIVTLADGSTVTGIINLPACIGILGLTALLVRGISESAKVNNIIVITKLAVIIAFIVIGVFYVNPDNWHPFVPEPTPDGAYGYAGVLRGAGVIFFAYIGFEAVSTAAQEARNPQRDMPIGILGSLGVCTVLYMMVALVLTGVVKYTELNVPDPIAVAVDHIGLGWFSFIIKVGAIMGLTSVMLVLLYGQTRIFYIMSSDGLLPKFLSKVHPTYKTPHINTMAVGAVVALIAATVPLSILGELVSMGTLCAFVVVCFSVLYLRKSQPDLPRPFRTPGMPFVPLLGIAACLYLISGLPLETFIRLKVWLILGLVIYFAYSQHHSKLNPKNKA